MVTLWQGPNYRVLFSEPTGKNGYEEYVKAGDQLAASPRFLELEKKIRADSDQGKDYLVLRRAEAHDFGKVLDLIAVGNRKAISNPRANSASTDGEPELDTFKMISDLSAHVAYADFAEGKTDEAIGILLGQLSFSRQIGKISFRAREVGANGAITAERVLADHGDQLSLDQIRKIGAYTDSELARPPSGLDCLPWEQSKSLLEVKNQSSDWIVSQIGRFYEQCRVTLAGPKLDWLPFLRVLLAPTDPSSSQAKVIEDIGIKGRMARLVKCEIVGRVRLLLLQLESRIAESRLLKGTLPSSLSGLTQGTNADDVTRGVWSYKVDGLTFILMSLGCRETGPIGLDQDVGSEEQIATELERKELKK